MEPCRSRFKRLAVCTDRVPIRFWINGIAYEAYSGDTVLTAILSVVSHVRLSDFNKTPRAGFCLIGACQDCYVAMADGHRVRACTTLLQPDMHFMIEKAEQHGEA